MRCHSCGEENQPNATVCAVCGESLTDDIPVSNVLPPGTKLQGGKYTINKVLGQGGFGITYLAQPNITCFDIKIATERQVAIKEFFPQGCVRQSSNVQPTSSINLADYQKYKAKFIDEIERIKQFRDCLNIVTVADNFLENNTAYMVMELVEGKSLKQLVEEKGKLSENEAIDYIKQLGDALKEVHQRNFLHRDIKPDNAILNKNNRLLVLIDFGTAREFKIREPKTMTTIYSPGYAAPEQYSNEPTLKLLFGPYTDIFGLGATMYHLLTGEIPKSVLDRLMGVEFKTPQEVNSSVSKKVSDAVMWAMEIKIEDRPQSVSEFFKKLGIEYETENFIDELGIEYEPQKPFDEEEVEYKPRKPTFWEEEVDFNNQFEGEDLPMTCTNCGHHFYIRSDLIKGNCPKCGNDFEIPSW